MPARARRPEWGCFGNRASSRWTLHWDSLRGCVRAPLTSSSGRRRCWVRARLLRRAIEATRCLDRGAAGERKIYACRSPAPPVPSSSWSAVNAGWPICGKSSTRSPAPRGPARHPVRGRDPPLQPAQQDVLLPEVEEGASRSSARRRTTPFAVNGPLLSRSSIFGFARSTGPRSGAVSYAPWRTGSAAWGTSRWRSTRALAFLAEASDGDARGAPTALEVGVLSTAERPGAFTERAEGGVGPAEGGPVRRHRGRAL